MNTRTSTRLVTTVILTAFLLFISPAKPIQASIDDAWWNADWPYRVQLSVSETGATAIQPDFTALFAQLGLPNALLDLDSIGLCPIPMASPANPSLFRRLSAQ